MDEFKNLIKEAKNFNKAHGIMAASVLNKFIKRIHTIKEAKKLIDCLNYLDDVMNN